MELKTIHNLVSELEKNLSINLLNKNKIIKELNVILSNSIENNINKNINYGVAFSGGIDSTLLAILCKKIKKNFKLYTVSVGEGEDLIWAKKASNYLKLPLVAKIIDFDEAYSVIKKVTEILNTDDPVKVGIGCVLFSVLNLMKNDNLNHVVTGLGSDSLFCGFEKHRVAFEKGDILNECIKGIKNIYENDIKRDLNICGHFNINLICPYLDKDVISYCMRIDPKLKINKNEKKIILRELALRIGLRKDFAFRNKLAAQYGSGFDKAIGVFTKENGFKYKREFLNSLLKNQEKNAL